MSAGGIAPVAPSEETVAAGPIRSRGSSTSTISKGRRERVTKFVSVALSPEAQALVSKVGYFPLERQRRRDALEGAAATTSTDAPR